MRVGAHVSAAGRLAGAVKRAVEIEAEAIQVFESAPQTWRPGSHAEDEFEEFNAAADEASVRPVFIHAIYLINLASADETLLHRSVGSLKLALRAAWRMHAGGVIFHVGSHKGVGFDAVREQIVRAMADALAASPDEARLIIENAAGQGGAIGSRLAEVGALVRDLASSRVGVCLDTCHAFAAGYNIAERDGLDAMAEEFDREIGRDKLWAVHANDSKGELGNGKDRHENIGEGFIGMEGFLTVMSHPLFRDVPFLLEVPGFSGEGPDLENVRRLKELRERAPAVVG